MESYLMMLYVTLEQESALKNFFVEHGWAYCKPDLSVVTDKVGPISSRLSIASEELDVTDTHLRDEDQVPRMKIKVPPASTAVTEEHSSKQSGKRKTKSQKQPSKAPKQAKIESSTSVTKPDELFEIHGKQNVDSEVEDNESGYQPITVEMEDGEQIHIKVESEDTDIGEKKGGHDIDEGEKVGDFSNDTEEDDNEDDDVEAADVDYEEESAGNTGVKIENMPGGDASISQVELPDDGSAPKHPRRKRGTVLRQYDTTSLQNAYKYVMETGSSVYSAARMFGVPMSTLRDRVRHRISVDVTKSGPGTVLSEDEETNLTAHLMELAELGYGYTQVEIRRQASYYAVELGKRTASSPFSKAWFARYIALDEEQQRIESFLPPKQKKLCTSEKCITNYYNKLNRLIIEYNLCDTPENIYLMDEVDIDVPAVKKCNTVTVIGAGNADGQKILPYFVMVSGLTEKDPCFMRRSHLITQGFKKYFSSHFMKYAKPGNDSDYILVLYDAHRTHLSVELIQWAKSNNILLFALPPHTSHIVKTSGEGVFQPIKAKYSDEYGSVTPYRFLKSTAGVVSIVKDIYEAVVTTAALKETFSKWGIYPLQEGKVMLDFLQKQEIIG